MSSSTERASHAIDHLADRGRRAARVIQELAPQRCAVRMIELVA
jgi:hypothetical protein